MCLLLWVCLGCCCVIAFAAGCGCGCNDDSDGGVSTAISTKNQLHRRNVFDIAIAIAIPSAKPWANNDSLWKWIKAINMTG